MRSLYSGSRAVAAQLYQCSKHQRVSLLAASPLRSARIAQHQRRTVRMDAAKEEEKTSGHQVPNSSVVSEDAVDPEIKAFQEHQRTAARISLADEVRTLVSLGTWGVICTQGRNQLDGFPAGSVVEYAVTEDGKPVFAFSTLSPHTGDLQKNGKASLVVTAQNFQGLQDARVCLTGEITSIADDQLPAMRELYKKAHPGSFWVDFGDFKWFSMQNVIAARVVGGFARAGSVTGEEYFACSPDPVAPFAGPVCGHMNEDHADSTTAIVKFYTGLTVENAKMLTIDRLGMNVQCSRDGQTFKARVPWTREVTDRKAIKDVIVEMTRAAAAAGKKEESVAAS